jgi:hypothetical protein
MNSQIKLVVTYISNLTFVYFCIQRSILVISSIILYSRRPVFDSWLGNQQLLWMRFFGEYSVPQFKCWDNNIHVYHEHCLQIFLQFVVHSHNSILPELLKIIRGNSLNQKKKIWYETYFPVVDTCSHVHRNFVTAQSWDRWRSRIREIPLLLYDMLLSDCTVSVILYACSIYFNPSCTGTATL